MRNIGRGALPGTRHVCCLPVWGVLGVALAAVAFLGVSTAMAHDGWWTCSLPCADQGCTENATHPDLTPFKGNFTVTVTNSGSIPWGDFHFQFYDPMGGQDISNLAFLDASMGGYDPTSSQGDLRWTINNVVIGAQMNLYFCTDPVMPGETATFVIYTSNPDHLSIFGVAFYPTPVPPSGACCYPDGSCVLTCQYDCLAPAFWHGELTSCTPNLCPQPYGSCCMPDGSCTVTLQADCTGVWTMSGTCTPGECAQPHGSCCYPDGSCAETLQAGCTGAWTMFGVCTPNTCAQPEGSCCYPDGTCAVTLQAGCTGAWTMSGTCNPNPCPQPYGSCCMPDGFCTVTEQADCTGVWTMSGTCTPNTCAQPTGACCDHATGNCTMTTQAACAFDWLGAGTLCSPETCPPPVFEGACCAPNGDCHISTQAQCPGTWILGGVCNPNPCPQPPIGVCCEGEGICTMTTEAACVGTWTVGGTCTPNPCPPVPTEQKTWGAIKNVYR